ncbi:hypothetical protein [Virgibacillus litoralis]|uniref:Uncharacterized protein n=1 Tax=Virgibacillus litoralis TaxID=578221 RepID=A0ABS4HH54_9BACI|nr:hypothetical protein [Virgibacillus litoralis]MBP1950262.1 hypothetical protein [Virgibacillus litoralis]
MDLREVYTESIAESHESLSLLIEFLVLEMKVLSFDDDQRELDLYFKPNNKVKMNKLLLEYRTKIGESA